MDVDIYVLVNGRDKEIIFNVLNKYLPNRSYQIGSHVDKFEFWDDSEEAENQISTIFDTELQLFNFLRIYICRKCTWALADIGTDESIKRAYRNIENASPNHF